MKVNLRANQISPHLFTSPLPSKVKTHENVCAFSVGLFQQRLGERLLDDSAPEGRREARERRSRSKREHALASADPGPAGAWDEGCQPTLPHPKTGTALEGVASERVCFFTAAGFQLNTYL